MFDFIDALREKMVGYQIVVSHYAPDVFPDKLPDGKPHPAAGLRWAFPANGVIYVSRETMELLESVAVMER